MKDLRSQRHKILTYFHELGDYYYLKRPDKLGNSQHTVTLTDLTKYAIALQLIEKYIDASEPVTDTNGESFRFIQQDGDDWHKNLKGLMTGMAGWFLQLLTAEPRQYDYEHTRKKWEEYSRDALLKTAHFLCCVPWHSEELLYFRSLFLNNLLYLGCKNLVNVEATGDMVVSYLEQQFKLLTNYKARYEQRLTEVKKSIVPSYYELVTNLSLKVEERSFKSRFNRSEFLYIKKYGVCYVTDISKAGDETFLTISRPGFEWDDEIGFISYQVKAKKFVPVG